MTPEQRAQAVVDADEARYIVPLTNRWLVAEIAAAIRDAVEAETARCVAVVAGFDFVYGEAPWDNTVDVVVTDKTRAGLIAAIKGGA